MKTRSTKESLAIRIGYFADALFHFLIGAVVLSLGLVALVRWVVREWDLGNRGEVLLVSGVAALLVAGFMLAFRAKNRILAFAIVLAWCGFLIPILHSIGIRLPLFSG